MSAVSLMHEKLTWPSTSIEFTLGESPLLVTGQGVIRYAHDHVTLQIKLSSH